MRRILYYFLFLLLSSYVQATNIICEKHGAEVECNGKSYTLERRDVIGSPSFYFHLATCVFLVLFAGMMSGLTIGLLSMDLTSLAVIKHGGEPHERIYASRIIPLVGHKHFLLVTLLLCNAGAMEALPIFLDKMVPSYWAIIISVTAVLFFGEIIPQAICSRYGLAIGYYLSWPVYFLMMILSFIAWPIGKVLDYVLGCDDANLYARRELKELIYIHGQDRPDVEEKLTPDEVTIMQGVLDMAGKTVETAMIKLSSVYALPDTTVLDHTLLSEILSSGYSRIPIYNGAKPNIVGAVLVKRLLTIDPNKPVRIVEFMSYSLTSVPQTYPLFSMLNDFQTGEFHMAVVKDGMAKVMGIITLEDVLEELIAEEIVDETDVYVDVQRRVHVLRKRTDLTRRVVQACLPTLPSTSKCPQSTEVRPSYPEPSHTRVPMENTPLMTQEEKKP